MSWHSTSDFFDKIRSIADDDWSRLLTESVQDSHVQGISFPTFPDSALQRAIHGHSGEQSILEALKYYREVMRYYRFGQGSFSESSTLLDFGCGWGRILRPFMRDFLPNNIFAMEPHPARVREARMHNPYVNIIQSPYLPPVSCRDESFDLIVSWSVFSHLDEFSTRKWFSEFWRILKPGGVIAVTTQGRSFIEQCDTARKRISAGEKDLHPWMHALAKSFVDRERYDEEYTKGYYLFSGTSGTIPDVRARYGEAIIPPLFVKNALAEGWDFIDHMDDPKRLPQALIVLQRPR